MFEFIQSAFIENAIVEDCILTSTNYIWYRIQMYIVCDILCLTCNILSLDKFMIMIFEIFFSTMSNDGKRSHVI